MLWLMNKPHVRGEQRRAWCRGWAGELAGEVNLASGESVMIII